MQAGIKDIDFHGLEAIQLQTAAGAAAVITLYGAQVLSWITPDRRERLFLSERAHYDMQHPIRGGIPISFPQFSGLGDLPKHGFLRQQMWTVGERQEEPGYVMVSLACRDTEATRRIWPHAFGAELSVALDNERLDVEFAVENLGSEAFSFTAALHTYLQVDEVESVSLEGLYGLEYRDAADGDKIKWDKGPSLQIDREVDRVYHGASASPLLLRDGGTHLGLNNAGFPDVVVWNPWEERCAQLADMPKLGFRRMLCVEAAAAQRPVQLPPGEGWWGRQSLLTL